MPLGDIDGSGKNGKVGQTEAEIKILFAGGVGFAVTAVTQWTFEVGAPDSPSVSTHAVTTHPLPLG
jgi:hypothetical protein